MIGPREVDASHEAYAIDSILHEVPSLGLLKDFYFVILVKGLFRVGYVSLLSVRFGSCFQGFH